MIPLKITLKGFLCYRDERTITLDPTASLWMLSGNNGSGKSTIFDAITFALFGHHRGGSRSASELINRQSDGLVVEFVFQLGTGVYRIRRTAKLNAAGNVTSTQQIYEGERKEDGDYKWVAIPNTTNLRDGFQPWIRDKIGLTYETFTSSVLLLQGQAEKLLSSKPEERRQVLASIVDLERYEVLYDRAVVKRKEADARVDALRERLASIPEVTDEQVEQAVTRISQAQQIKSSANEKLEQTVGLVRKAQEWQKVQVELFEARNRVDAANRLLADGPRIEQEATRLRELNTVLPQIKVILEERQKADDARKLRTQNQAELQRLNTEQESRVTRREQTAGLRQREQTAIAQAEKDQQGTQTELRGTTEQMTRLRQCESQEVDLAGLQKQLAELPGDLDKQLGTLRQNLEQTEQVARVLPLLSRFQSGRDELREALTTEKQAIEHLQTVEAQGKKLKEEIEALRPQVDEAERQAERASAAGTRAETLLHQAQDALTELDSLGEASRCRHCGSNLTAKHREEERVRRQQEVRQAEENLRAAQKNSQTTQLLRQQQRDRLATQEEQRTAARDAFVEARNRRDQARATVQRLQQDLARLHGEIEAPFQKQIGPAPVADWLGTTFPTREDLARFQTQATQAASLRQRIRTLETQLTQRATLQGQIASMTSAIAQLQAKLPADRAALRQKHLELETREKQLTSTLEARKKELRNHETLLDKLDKELTSLRQDISQLQLKIQKSENDETNALAMIERIRAALPSGWAEQVATVRLAAWNTWETERRKLQMEGVDEREEQLRDARANLGLLSQQRERLEQRAAEYPLECRQEPTVLEELVAAARRDLKECETQLTQAQQQQGLLEQRIRDRQTVTDDLTTAEGVQAEAELLARLLGRDRLQLHLVRQAERRVVEYANVVLDRLSGGQLYLQLQGDLSDGAATRALNLVCINRQTDERPINVAFLSGSQRFRVAVSLALGIGQYASRQHRPLECVIIDEGFGCLDRQGRQVMIQELQNLRNCLRSILLVSHQEEFADAFPNGYHFALVDGTTEVTRVQR